jgi:hypothetical protein
MRSFDEEIGGKMQTLDIQVIQIIIMKLPIIAALALLLAAGAALKVVEAMSTRPSEIGDASITDRTSETWRNHPDSAILR